MKDLPPLESLSSEEKDAVVRELWQVLQVWVSDLFSAQKHTPLSGGKSVWLINCGIARFRGTLREILNLKPKSPEGQQLLKHYLKIREHLLLFLEDETVPPTDNSRERTPLSGRASLLLRRFPEPLPRSRLIDY